MRDEISYGNGLFSVIKAVCLALGISFLSVLIFASVLRCTHVSDKAIYPINQTIKVISIFLGGLFFINGDKGWLKGLGVGALFTAVSYLTFSALGGGFALSGLAVAELALGIIAGILSGIVAVNSKR